MERFRLRILGLDWQLPSLNVIGRGLSGYAPPTPQPPPKGRVRGWMGIPRPELLGCILQLPTKAAAVTSRNRPCFSEVDKSGSGAGGLAKETPLIGCTGRAERLRKADWWQVLPGSNQVKA